MLDKVLDDIVRDFWSAESACVGDVLSEELSCYTAGLDQLRPLQWVRWIVSSEHVFVVDSRIERDDMVSKSPITGFVLSVQNEIDQVES